MLKSICVLFLVALIHIFFGSCILWKESFLSLKQANLYFLFLIMGVSAICAGINYIYTFDQINHSILYTQKKVWLLYALLLVINILATCLFLSENIEMSRQIQKDLLDLFLPSFFFLLGIDMWIFMPFEKYFRDLYSFYIKKMGLVSVLASVILLRNPKTIF